MFLHTVLNAGNISSSSNDFTADVDIADVDADADDDWENRDAYMLVLLTDATTNRFIKKNAMYFPFVDEHADEDIDVSLLISPSPPARIKQFSDACVFASPLRIHIHAVSENTYILQPFHVPKDFIHKTIVLRAFAPRVFCGYAPARVSNLLQERIDFTAHAISFVLADRIIVHRQPTIFIEYNSIHTSLTKSKLIKTFAPYRDLIQFEFTDLSSYTSSYTS